MAPFSSPAMKPTLTLLLAQSRVLKALAGGAVLQGTPDELIRHLDVSPDVLSAALHDLVAGRWTFASSTPDGCLIVGCQLGQRNEEPPSRRDRRSSASLREGV